MNFDHRNPRLRRGFAFVALAAVLGLAAVGLTQCRNVSDSVTGVDLTNASGLHARNSCTRQCNSKYKTCVRDEEKRYKKARTACHWDYRCRKDEFWKHIYNLKQCSVQLKLCKKNCYNEGAGSVER
jgi:hypothetical protein